MRIGIDVSMIDNNKAGIGYYAYSLVQSLSQIDKSNQYFLFVFNKELIKDLSLPSNFEIIEVKGTGNLKWMLKCLPKIHGLKLDQFLSPSNLFWGCVLNNCTTVVHDIAQILHPQFFYKKGNLFYRIELSLLLRRKGFVVTPSNAVKKEIKEHYKYIRARIEVIKEGLHEWVFKDYTNDFKQEVIAKYKLPEHYVLTVGTLEPRKNLVNVILAFKEYIEKYNSDIKLVIVGKKGWFFDQIYKTVEENNLTSNVKFLGYVPDSDLPVIYDLCDFVVSLSYYEGFGLPLIEANARGKFVLGSDIEVYRELEASGVYISPYSDPKDLGRAFNGVNGFQFKPDPIFFDTYSWKSTARHFLDLWH